jgi:succinate-semialdehyde dehydrogenase/glutarate-semialdehyde dehydrogenase
MELGGNAPFVVTTDADISAAVQGAMSAKFRNGGQACTAANRFYVHSSVADEFIARFGAAIEALIVGPATSTSTQIGPLINQRAVEGVSRLVEDAIVEGARVAHQARSAEGGYYYPPTLLVDVAHGSSILREEIFGPIAPVVTWRDEDEMIRHANDTEFGLASYVFAGDLERALRIAERLDTGMVGINRGVLSDPSAPFGGTKQSGLGREGAREGMRAFQETQFYSVDWS